MTNICVTKPSRVKQEGHGYMWGEEKMRTLCVCVCGGGTERKRLLGKPKWEDYIRILP